MTDIPDLLERVEHCPHCQMNWRMFPPARITSFDAAFKQFETGDVRCVECKTVFTRAALLSLSQDQK